MNTLFTKSLVISTLFISACSTQTGWTPTVDPYGNPNSYRLEQDVYECRQLALRASGNTAMETAKGTAIGAFIGAAAGAAIGAAVGDPGVGAAIGAAAGGFGGGTKQGFGTETNYERAYTNCLRHRGHYVIN